MPKNPARSLFEGILLVTSNPNKAKEAQSLLSNWGVTVVPCPIDLPEMQSLDFAAVVRAKAEEAVRQIAQEALPNWAILVEDSGLAIPAWQGFPGPFTKWITAVAGVEALARMLDGFEDRKAEAVSAVALAIPPSPFRVVAVVGRVAGTIARSPRGTGGFGWDSIFVPEGETRTFAEMEPSEKDRRSHRAAGFQRLAEEVRRLAG